MKYVCLFVWLLSWNVCFSQESFEGTIIYKAIGSEKKDSGYLTIYFSKPGIRIELVEAKNTQRTVEAIIVNLDSGKVLTLNPDNKKYGESILEKKLNPTPLDSKIIAGFTTTPIILEFSKFGAAPAFLKEPHLHIANDLHYKIPDMYEGNFELMMIQKNKIVLGAEFFIEESSYPNELDETRKEHTNIFNVFATKVNPEKLNEDLFRVPADFTKRMPYNYSSDSASLTIDSFATYPVDTTGLQQYQPPVKKKKSPSKKKSSATRQNATRRKEN